jgi:hypothetical protein
VSEAWAWLGGYDIARPEAGHLFEQADLLALPIRSEHSVEEVNALLATMSFWSRLSPQERAALTAANEAVARRLGRPIRSSTAACLLTARSAR